MRWLSVSALVVLLGSWSLVASADDGAAALLPFQGPQAGKVRQSVQKGLREAGVPLRSLKQVNAVAKKTQDYAKRAARLEATVLVRARVRRADGRWIADTDVRDAAGQRMKKLRTTSSSWDRLSGQIVRDLVKTGLMPTATTKPEPEPSAPTQPRLVVRPFKGAQGSKARIAVIRGLRSQPVEFYPNRRFVDEAQSLGANLQQPGGHVPPSTALAVSGLLEGDVLREDGIWSAYVRLVDGQSAEVLRQHYYDSSTLKGLLRNIQANVGSDFRKDVSKLDVRKPGAAPVVPVAPPTPQAVEERPTPKQTPAPKAKPKRKRPAAVDIEADFRIVRRQLTYNDDLGGDLRDYTLKAGPGVALKFQYFPGAHFTSGIGAQFGIDFEWERLFDFESAQADGTEFPTESQQFLIGVRWRYPVKRWEPFVVIDYGVHDFELGVSGPPVPGEEIAPGVPSVKYEFVRIGAGFRVALGKKDTFIIGGHIALRAVFSVGGIGTNVWFPEATANGMDTGLVFGFALPLGFEVRLGIDYRRYGLDLNPVPPNPPYVAGGALDRYLGATVGFAWRR